ncbi:MAG: hypothetical protein IPJ77_00005 [Planctomycetes bacterium]|nr:hypothetical protein [Planctomycetota bacterium]
MSSSIEDDPWVGDAVLARRAGLSRRTKAWIAGCAVALLFVLVGGGVLLYALARRPKGYVVPREDVPARTIVWLSASGLLEPDERVRRFYSDAAWDERSSGCFCTNRRVVRYRDGDAGRTVDEVRYSDLVELHRRAGAPSSKTIELEFVPQEGAPFTLVLPTRRGGDREFEEEVRGYWRWARPELAYASEGRWFRDGGAPADVLAFLAEHSVLLEGERPLVFFGAVGTPLVEWGTFCTSERLVVYSFEAGKEPVNWHLRLEHVDALEAVPGDPSIERTASLRVRTVGAQAYELDGDLKLLDLFRPRLQTAVDAARKR